MNILIIQSKAFPHRDNSFCYFYTQLAEWLTAMYQKVSCSIAIWT